MEKQYQVLAYLYNEEYTSQRAIAEKTGLSLGTVNILLKKMIEKGLVKTERLDARSLRYIVTPKGLTEKMKLTYSFVKRSYLYIKKIMNVMDEIINNAKKRGLNEVYLIGNKNEVYEIIKIALKENNVCYTYINDVSQLSDKKEDLIIIWEAEVERQIPSEYKIVNIIKYI